MSNRVRVSIGADKDDLALVHSVVEEFATRRGLTEHEANALVASVDGVCSWLIDHAYPSNPLGELAVQLELESGAVRVVVEDWGEPIRAFGGSIGSVPEALANVTLEAHDLRLVNLGSEGKRTSFAVPAEAAQATATPPFGELKRESDSTEHTADEVVIRDATPDDADEISRLLFNQYGLGYAHPSFYDPSWVSEQIGTGTIDSTIALVAGEIVGHHALMPLEGESGAESGVAVVHPGYRGLGVFNKLFGRTVERAQGHELDGVFGRAVTSHPYSQRAEFARGYRESALLLGGVPANRRPDMTLRGSTLLSVLAFGEKSRQVTLPQRYSEWLSKTFERLDLTAAQPLEAAPGSAEWPSVRVHEETSEATTIITVHRFDGEARDELLTAIRGSVRRHDDVALCDLDLRMLSASELDKAIDLLRSHDFFYSGLMPFGFGGHDRLRMQALLTEEIDFDGIVLDSDFGKQIQSWVMQDYRLVTND
jgi:N-acetylglutamate synthase-like GNAT family acetyltransferase/anti-sigma regulatory factor (Ser/Thr protein kinase)